MLVGVVVVVAAVGISHHIEENLKIMLRGITLFWLLGFLEIELVVRRLLLARISDAWHLGVSSFLVVASTILGASSGISVHIAASHVVDVVEDAQDPLLFAYSQQSMGHQHIISLRSYDMVLRHLSISARWYRAEDLP